MIWSNLGSYYQEFRRFQQHQPYPYFMHIYQTLSQAITESLGSLIKLYPHKKRVFLFLGQSPFEKYIINQVQSMGCLIKTKSILEAFDLNEFQEFDPGVIVYAEDHALKGDFFDQLGSYQAQLNRVGVLSWSHFLQATGSTLYNYHVRIIPKQESRFVAYCSERIETQPGNMIYDNWIPVHYNEVKNNEPIEINKLINELQQRQFKIWTSYEQRQPFHLLIQYLGELSFLNEHIKQIGSQVRPIQWQELNLLPDECLWGGITLQEWKTGSWFIFQFKQ